MNPDRLRVLRREVTLLVCEMMSQERDGREARVILRGGEKAKRGEEEVGADEGEESEASETRRSGAALAFESDSLSIHTASPKATGLTKRRIRRFLPQQRP